MPQVPGTAVVIGGGAIGCEFASMMADLGTQVTVLEALPKILPGCDKDVTKVVVRSFKKRGIDVRTGVNGHRPRAGRRRHHGQRRGRRPSRSTSSSCRSAAGPPPTTSASTAPAVEVDERGFVVVDELLPHRRGRRVGRRRLHRHAGSSPTSASPRPSSPSSDILGEDPMPVDYGKVPWGIYCHPEVAFAGHTEEAAKEAGLDVVASKHRYSGNGRAHDRRRPEGLVKVIAEKTPDGTAGTIARRAHGRARGSPSSSARATWPSTGRPRSTRSPPSSSRTRRCASCSARRCRP